MESYLQSAYNLFLNLVTWMKNTTILTIRGNNVTFLGLLIALTIFNILVSVIWYIIDVYGFGE